MAKLPLEDHNVEGLDGPEFELNILCAAPGCYERSQDIHHVWRRSFLGGDYNWVILPDGSHLGNLVGLCRPHHEQLEAMGAWITWEDSRFLWTTLTAAGLPLGFQPPLMLGEIQEPSPLASNGADGAWVEPHVHKENECPTCHQPLPKPKIEGAPEKKRERRTWSITIPVDHREDGAETLDTLLEELRLELAKTGQVFSADLSNRWSVVARIFGLALTHFDSIVADA